MPPRLDAQPAAALLKLTGQAEIEGKTLHETAVPKQEIYLPGGGRGLYPVQTLALAVTAESDITVEATPKEITLAPGKTATIDVTVARHQGYNKGVNLSPSSSATWEELSPTPASPRVSSSRRPGARRCSVPRRRRAKSSSKPNLTPPHATRCPSRSWGTSRSTSW